jgi:hypothetical protein
MEKLNYNQYNQIERVVYQNIFDLQNWYANAKYKILSIAIPKILIAKDKIEYIYDDIINKALISLEDIYNKKMKEILNEPRTKYFARSFASDEF